jgi:hypothetical protein
VGRGHDIVLPDQDAPLPDKLDADAFASVLVLENGGVVPGVGHGDIVPAMLEPGDAVKPKRLTEGLTMTARSGNSGGGHHNPRAGWLCANYPCGRQLWGRKDASKTR